MARIYTEHGTLPTVRSIEEAIALCLIHPDWYWEVA
jgi:hypothetical protein